MSGQGKTGKGGAGSKRSAGKPAAGAAGADSQAKKKQRTDSGASSSAAAGGDSDAGSESDSNSEEQCERCGLSGSYSDDALVLCDFEGGEGGEDSCATGLHQSCFSHFTGVKLPETVKARKKFKNYCSVHAMEGGPHGAYNVDAVHNLPEFAAEISESSKSGEQIFLPHPLWQKGRDANAAQSGLLIKASKIASAGLGCFAVKGFKKNTVVGCLFGMFRSSHWFEKSKMELMTHPCVWKASQYSEEDFGDSAFTGRFRFLSHKDLPTLEDMGEEEGNEENFPVLTVSKQCPLGYANSPDSEGNPGANVKLVVDTSVPSTNVKGILPWNKFTVVAKKEIAKDEEIILEYGWSEEDWEAMRKQQLMYKSVKELRQKWLDSGFTAKQMWVWASSFKVYEEAPVHWKDREGLAKFLGNLTEKVPTQKQMDKACDKAFRSAEDEEEGEEEEEEERVRSKTKGQPKKKAPAKAASAKQATKKAKEDEEEEEDEHMHAEEEEEEDAASLQSAAAAAAFDAMHAQATDPQYQGEALFQPNAMVQVAGRRLPTRFFRPLQNRWTALQNTASMRQFACIRQETSCNEFFASHVWHCICVCLSVCLSVWQVKISTWGIVQRGRGPKQSLLSK